MYKELEKQVDQAVKINNRRANSQINGLQARRDGFEEGTEAALKIAWQIAIDEANKSCPCCQGDEPVAEMDDATMLFVDGVGNFAVFGSNGEKVMMGQFPYCPICGRKFESE